MAKKKKPDAAEGEEGAAAAPKSKKKLMMIGAAVAVLIAAGGGGWFFFMKKPHADSEMTATPGAAVPGAVIDLEEMKISLAAGPGEERQAFLKMRVALEVKDADAAKLVEPLLPRVVDSFQVFMRELRPNDLDGSAGIYRLKEEMMRRVNVAVYPHKVEAILFKELLVQ
jgi:flagellar protein FliL